MGGYKPPFSFLLPLVGLFLTIKPDLSNPFLKDFEVVILFVMWVESPSLKASLIKGRFGGIVGMSRRGRPPIRKKRRNKSFLLFE